MGPAVHRSPGRRHSSDRLDSPVRGQHSPRRSSPRKERSPPRHRSSPRRRSPVRSSSSHRTRSPPRETTNGRTRSPKRRRPPSPVSRSPSPRTKRLMGGQPEQRDKSTDKEHARNVGREDSKGSHRERGMDREVVNGRSYSPVSRSPSPSTKRFMGGQSERRVKSTDGEHVKNSGREGDNGRKREKDVDRGVINERRSARDITDGGSSKSRHDRSKSPAEHGRKSRYGSSSPPRTARGGACDEEASRSGGEQSRDGESESVAKMKAAEEALEAKQKDKPSFELSGKLAAETNRVRGVTLLFNEPPDAWKPNRRWRLYVFKAGEVLNEPLYIHRQTCYLFGRERRVADIPTDHPSCSKQHAVIQFRQVEKEQPDGMMLKQVRPYLMDLGSTNGTFINDNRIEPQRYYELVEKDTIKFGNSSREYVILHENSTD